MANKKRIERRKKTQQSSWEGGRHNLIKVQTGWDSGENYDCRKCMVCLRKIDTQITWQINVQEIEANNKNNNNNNKKVEGNLLFFAVENITTTKWKAKDVRSYLYVKIISTIP